MGWYHGRQCQVLTDERPAAQSPLARGVMAGSVRSSNLIAHVRKATQGRIRQSNCHPFRRSLWERDWLFAHNGDLRGISLAAAGPYFACGDTDSEPAFCALLNRLFERFGAVEPCGTALAGAVADIAASMSAHGPFNFLLSNGDLLFARCSTELHFVERAHPFGRAHLIDTGAVIDFALHNHRHDRVAVIATRPLTSDESWQRLAPGELQVFRAGARVPDWSAQHAEPAHARLPAAMLSDPRAVEAALSA